MPTFDDEPEEPQSQFEKDLDNYVDLLHNKSSDVYPLFDMLDILAENMTPLERLLYVYGGNFLTPADCTIFTVWTLKNEDLTAGQWYRELRQNEPLWKDKDANYLNNYPLDEAVFPMIDKYIKDRGYAGVILSGNTHEDEDNDEVWHCFVLLPNNKIINSHMFDYGVKLWDWDYVSNLKQLAEDPSAWTKVFNITISDDTKVPTKLYISLF